MRSCGWLSYAGGKDALMKPQPWSTRPLHMARVFCCVPSCYSTATRSEPLPSGHYVNEEAPEQVLAWFMRFFGS